LGAISAFVKTTYIGVGLSLSGSLMPNKYFLTGHQAVLSQGWGKLR
jgi:hypothetical protein